MKAMFGSIDILIYIDELLGYSKPLSELLEKVRETFGVCQKKDLNFQPEKYELVAAEIQFWLRVINKNGIKFHARQYEALKSMSSRTTVGALMNLIHDANWMWTAIPNFAQLISLLHNLLEDNYTAFKNR